MILHGLRLAGWKFTHTSHATIWFAKVRCHLVCSKSLEKNIKDYASAHHSTCSPFLSICSKSSQNRSRSSCLLQPSACQALGAETETQQATSHHLSPIKSWETQKTYKYSCVFLHRWKMEKSHTTPVIVILSQASQLLLLVQPYLVNKTSLLGGCANKIWTKMKAHEGHLPTFEEWTIRHTTIETNRCTWCS